MCFTIRCSQLSSSSYFAPSTLTHGSHPSKFSALISSYQLSPLYHLFPKNNTCFINKQIKVPLLIIHLTLTDIKLRIQQMILIRNPSELELELIYTLYSLVLIHLMVLDALLMSSEFQL
jgi:hypothetical protein